MKGKKINYFDEAEYRQIQRDFSAYLFMANIFAEELAKYGYSVTKDAISDCFSARQETEKVKALDDFSQSVGGKDANIRYYRGSREIKLKTQRIDCQCDKYFVS